MHGERPLGPHRAVHQPQNLQGGVDDGRGVPLAGPDQGMTACHLVMRHAGQVHRQAPAGLGALQHPVVALQAPDPGHPDELLLTADQPGELTIFVRAREGMMERRATRSVTAVAAVPDPAPPVTLRLFLQGWGLVVVAIVAVGFAGALVALGSLASADFIALAAPRGACSRGSISTSSFNIESSQAMITLCYGRALRRISINLSIAVQKASDA